MFIIQSCENAKTQEAKKLSIVGAWEYILDNQEGLLIATETHFTWVITTKNRVAFAGDMPTEAEKAAAYSSTIAAAGTYTITDSVITWNIKYSKNPGEPGISFTTVNKIDGDMNYYKAVNPDGTIRFKGATRKIN